MEEIPAEIMSEGKERIIEYLNEQLQIKLEALKQYEVPIKEMKDKSPQEMEAFLIRHDVYELQKHIAVIKML